MKKDIINWFHFEESYSIHGSQRAYFPQNQMPSHLVHVSKMLEKHKKIHGRVLRYNCTAHPEKKEFLCHVKCADFSVKNAENRLPNHCQLG